MRRRGRTIALSTVAVGIAVLVGVGFAAKDWFIDESHIWNLKEGTPEERKVAMEALTKSKCLKAVPALLALRGSGIDVFVIEDSLRIIYERVAPRGGSYASP